MISKPLTRADPALALRLAQIVRRQLAVAPPASSSSAIAASFLSVGTK